MVKEEDGYSLTEDEITYILEDRRWMRQARIIRARASLRRAKTPREKWFWRFVININTID